MKIQELEIRTGLDRATIRYYERLNFIQPKRQENGYRDYTADDLEELLKDTARPIFVGCEDGRMLGYCFCIIEEVKDNPVLRDVKSLYIDDLCVDETIRGKHVGSRLYDHVCAYAKNIGCRSVTLNVWQGNDSAMAFYEKRGMKPRKVYMEVSLENETC